jgi:hypothetical protein
MMMVVMVVVVVVVVVLRVIPVAHAGELMGHGVHACVRASVSEGSGRAVSRRAQHAMSLFIWNERAVTVPSWLFHT